MLKKIKFWLECSRWYALPMTFFSWLIIFCYGLNMSGDVKNGILALVGISFAHLATNLFDDFCDYHKLTRIVDFGNVILPNTQRGKCRYLIENQTTLNEVLSVVIFYCLIAFLIGIYFYLTCGTPVLIFMFAGISIVLGYSFFSYIRLSELAVAAAFGPLMFFGTFFVMTNKISIEPLILSVPSMLFTVNLIYTDTFLDKEIDKKEEKRTLVNLFSTDDKAIFFQKCLIAFGYISVLLLPVFDITDWEVLFVYLTIPLAIDLIKSLCEYAKDNTFIPKKKWYHFPFEEWKDIAENRSQVFMFRMYQARNLMIYISLIITLSLLFSY